MSEVSVEQLETLLSQANLGLKPSVSNKVLDYYRLLIVENEKQNLTRLISPQDFFEGHLLDCIEGERSGLIGKNAVDLGSGCGVPGLLMAILNPERNWTLCESEVGKAKFLEEASKQLELERVKVFYGRIEELMKSAQADSIVARAVGTAQKLMTWLEKSSTWNNLVLFKGPKWPVELEELSRSRFKRSTQSIVEFSYEVGAEKKQRVLVSIPRVPRGTK